MIVSTFLRKLLDVLPVSLEGYLNTSYFIPHLYNLTFYAYRAVWHQADPITKGTRWALVIFYKIEI
jgi:hypothetical protein